MALITKKSGIVPPRSGPRTTPATSHEGRKNAGFPPDHIILELICRFVRGLMPFFFGSPPPPGCRGSVGGGGGRLYTKNGLTRFSQW